VIFQDFSGLGIFKRKKSSNFHDFPGGVGTLLLLAPLRLRCCDSYDDIIVVINSIV